MLTDLHTHLADDDAPLTDDVLDPAHVRRYADAAHARGIGAVGITEHVYRFAVARDWVDHPHWRETAVADLDRYVACLRAAQDDGMPVLVGLEVDHVAGAVDAARELSRRPDWDYLLGSVHWLGDLQVDYPANAIWERFGEREAWERYVDAVCEAAETGCFDSMSHPDLAKVFGNRPDPKPIDLYTRLADSFAAAGVCAEVSTAGYRRALGEIYPDPELLAMLARRDVPVTLASDAHAPEGIGLHYDRALRVLHDAGYRTITLFRRRERRQVPLG